MLTDSYTHTQTHTQSDRNKPLAEFNDTPHMISWIYISPTVSLPVSFCRLIKFCFAVSNALSVRRYNGGYRGGGGNNGWDLPDPPEIKYVYLYSEHDASLVGKVCCKIQTTYWGKRHVGITTI